MTTRILEGDALAVLKTLPPESVHCCVTSPPYFGLRDYGHPSQLGLESNPTEYVSNMVQVFGLVRELLVDDGVLWLNLGDSYNAAGRGGHGTRQGYKQGSNRASATNADNCRPSVEWLKPKDLIGIPWRVAFALQADGWYLRQDIIWAKPNPMPESVTDRCTKSHEYVFLLTKSERYYYDHEAIKEPVTLSTIARLSQDVEGQAGSDRVPGKTNGNMKAVGKGGKNAFRGQGHFREGATGPANREGRDMQDVGRGDTRNKRSVWTVATQPYADAHFATYPPKLIEPCILAGCPKGGVVLDPFFGSGTTGLVAERLGRDCIGIELNPAYAVIARNRINDDAPLFAKITA